MIKLVSLTTIVLFLCCCNNNGKQPSNASLSPACPEPDILQRVVRTDTIYHKKMGYAIGSYDQKSRLVKNITTIFSGVDSSTITITTRIFDATGHLLYEHISANGAPLQCYSYTYYDNGELASKQGFGSGQDPVKESYPKKERL